MLVPSTNNYPSTPKNMNKDISNTKVMKKDITDTKDMNKDMRKINNGSSAQSSSSVQGESSTPQARIFPQNNKLKNVIMSHPCCCRNCKHNVNGGESCTICHVPSDIKNKVNLNNRIDLSNRYICPVTAMTVRADGPGMNNASPDDYERAISHADEILSIIGSIGGGVGDFQNALLPVITSSGKLLNPRTVPFRVISKHFFSDFDGRARYGIMGAPGGDLGEFFFGNGHA